MSLIPSGKDLYKMDKSDDGSNFGWYKQGLCLTMSLIIDELKMELQNVKNTNENSNNNDNSYDICNNDRIFNFLQNLQSNVSLIIDKLNSACFCLF